MLRWLWYSASGLCLYSQEAIGDVHIRGIMYRAVAADIGNSYLDLHEDLMCLLERSEQIKV